jgi:pimeloyl-ACP methyl ester carboxylesterase
MREELHRIRRFMRRLDKGEPEAPTPPPLPPGAAIVLNGRGETFARITTEPADRTPVLLLHGWTASADTNFFPLYPELDGVRRVVAIDHRGHGRGMRPEEAFSLEACADDAAALLRQLGIDRVVVAGYSMGGPIALHFWQRHPDLVAGMVLAATALEWRSSVAERITWRLLAFLDVSLRIGTAERFNERLLREMVDMNPDLEPIRAWLAGEMRRGAPTDVVDAGRALSRYDARPFAHQVDVPVAVVLTTEDRLVKPRKQRALAAATRARILKLHGDHDVPVAQPKEFAAVMHEAIDAVDGLVG